MKPAGIFTLMIFSILSSCTNTPSNHPASYQQVSFQQVSLKQPFDAMPREGWATDPNFSYRFYSYYPADYVHGGTYQPYYHLPLLY